MKRSELFFTFLLIPIDIVMILLAFILAYKSRLYFEYVPATYFEPFREYLKFILFLIPGWILIFVLTGLYSIRERRTPLNEFGKIVVAVSAAIALMMAWIFLSRTSFFSRLIIVFSWALAIMTVTFGRFLIRAIRNWLYRYGLGVHRVIVLGHNSSTRPVINEIKGNKRLGYKIIRLIDREAIEKLEAIVKRNPCDEIIIADSTLPENLASRVLEFCRLHNLSFKMTPNLFLVRSSHVSIEELAGVPILEFKRTPLDGWGKIIKRTVDLVGSLILIILFSPIMIITAILVKLSSRGPIFFKQERVGLDNHSFKLMKFRSMKFEYCTGDKYGGKKAEQVFKKLAKRNEADGPIFKIKNDPRVTTFGKFIRKTSLDELPQFFNVLKGEMSLIGPRPPLPEEVAQYTKWQRRRLGVKPGITGLWQVSGRSELSFDEWVRLDAYYIENWSLWLDFQIFLKTILIVLRGRGAY